MKRIISATLLSLIVILANSQTRVYEKVHIDSTTIVKKEVLATFTLAAGETAIETTKIKTGPNEVISTRNFTTGNTLSNVIAVSGDEMEGYCNLISRDKESNKIYIDYWFYPSYSIPNTATVQLLTYAYTCDGLNGTPTLAVRSTESIQDPSNPKNIELQNCYYAGKKRVKKEDGWYPFIEKEYQVTIGAETIYYYDLGLSTASYYIEVDSDMEDKFSYQAVDFGVMTIPIKLRFARERSNLKELSDNSKFIPIRDEVLTDFSTGLSVGYSWGSYSFQRSGKETIKLNDWSITATGFIGVTGTTIDSLSTRRHPGLMRKDEKSGILVISPGMGVVLNYQNINLAILGGKDFGAGQFASKWNYDSAWWIGIGLGYKLNSFWKKDS